MSLTLKQQEGVTEFSKFLSNPNQKEFRLAGFSGCGKSYLTTYLIQLIDKKKELTRSLGGSFNYDIVLTATTNKAAKALKDALGETHPLSDSVTTIHSYLSLVIQNDFTTGQQKLIKGGSYKVKHNVICFIDEASMADTHLLKIIRESFINSKIIFIGDPDQILPVFHTLSPVFVEPSEIFLDETVRQAKGSNITTLGHAYRAALTTGLYPVVEDYANGVDVEIINGSTFKSLTEQFFTSQEYKDNPNYCKILGWTNNRVQEYNSFIRNLYTAQKPFVDGEYVIANQPVIRNQVTEVPNETVLQILKASPVFDMYGLEVQELTFRNGHYITPIDFKKASDLIKSYAKAKDWQTYFSLKEELCDFRANHALTVHKSQGSTYDYVFLDLNDIGRNNQNAEIARLMYVATTRARIKVFIYGSLPARLPLCQPITKLK
jgi:hypothetical protein